MAKRPNEELRLQIVKEVLVGIKVGVLSRMYDIHPETIREWIRNYRDSIPVEEVPSAADYWIHSPYHS